MKGWLINANFAYISWIVSVFCGFSMPWNTMWNEVGECKLMLTDIGASQNLLRKVGRGYG
jgi:hypothetical protein